MIYKKKSGSSELVKITFRLAQSSWHGSATESLWAEPVGPQTYRIKNVPFYALGVSFEDVVFANDDNNFLVFAKVDSHGGHSTYRMVVDTSREDKFEEFWEPLRALGCTYEEGSNRLLAVDVPPEADIYQAYKGLESGEAAGVWSFEEGHCGHPIRKK